MSRIDDLPSNNDFSACFPSNISHIDTRDIKQSNDSNVSVTTVESLVQDASSKISAQRGNSNHDELDSESSCGEFASAEEDDYDVKVSGLRQRLTRQTPIEDDSEIINSFQRDESKRLHSTFSNYEEDDSLHLKRINYDFIWQYLFLFNAIKFLCAVDKIMTKPNSSLLLISDKRTFKKRISYNKSLQCNK
jgi:hypothetical protein